jgi:hypothetical protein
MKLRRKMIGLAVCSALLCVGGRSLLYAGDEDGQGQNQNQQGNADDPFHGKTDSGDDAHILPTPDILLGKNGAKPSFASKNTAGKATVFQAPYGSGNLINHGGPEISNASFYAVYWNSSVANSTQSTGYTTVSQQIQAFVLSFGSGNNYSGAPTDDFSIIQQYGTANPISSKLPLAGTLVDSKSNQSNISDSGIRNWLSGLFKAHRLTPSSSTLYGLYFPSGMKVSLNFFQSSCTYFCGYHSSYNYNGISIKYAVFPYLNCSGCSIGGLSVGDMLTIVSSHEIREAVSDPLGNAWYDSSGYEADDKCVWTNLYQMANGGFWVQPEFSNGGGIYPGPGCVVPF